MAERPCKRSRVELGGRDPQEKPRRVTTDVPAVCSRPVTWTLPDISSLTVPGPAVQPGAAQGTPFEASQGAEEATPEGRAVAPNVTVSGRHGTSPPPFEEDSEESEKESAA